MKIKKNPSSAKRLAHMPPSLKNFISTLETCPQSDLVKHIESYGTSWSQPRGDLHHWIPVLNRFDEILEEVVNRTGLVSNMPTSYMFEREEETLIVSVLQFTALLLEHCSHRSLYSSGSHLANLLFVTSLPILVANLKVCARLALRYAQANTGRSSIFVISREKIFQLAKSYPPPQPLDVTTKVSLYDLIDESKPLNGSWSSINLQYYQVSAASSHHSELPAPPVTPSPMTGHEADIGNDAKVNDGVLSYTVLPHEVANTSMQGLMERVFSEIPKDFQVDAFLKTRVAKACVPGPDGLELRRQLTAVRCLAIEFLAYIAQEDVLQSRLFAGDSQVIPSLCDLIHPDNNVPISLRTMALESLQALAHLRSRHNEILSSLSANVNHGLLLYIVRQVVKDLNQGVIVNEYFADRLFSLIQVLASNNHSVQVLVTAGLIEVMVQLIDTESQDFGTLAMAVAVSQHMVCIAPSAFTEFVQAGGLDIVVRRITEEVDYDIAHPEDVEESVLIDYKINYVRAHFLKSLFKLLLSMLQSTNNADRLRNLVESPILESLKKIISNSALFGTNVTSCAIEMMSTLIHNEPTSYTIINESRLPQVFVDAIPELIKLSKTTAIPHAIGAICLNNSGLELVQSSGALKKYFQVFKMHFHAQIMTLTSVPNSLGNAFDEMVRHHPALKDEIMSEIVQVAKDICATDQTIPGGVRFFPVRPDSPRTSADDELVVQDSNSEIVSLIDCFARFLEAFLQNTAHCKEFTKRNGLVYLVRFYSLPSLPYDFPSRSASVSLAHVFRLATEVNAFWTITTILKACTETMQTIKKFLEYNEPTSFFTTLEEEDTETASTFLRHLNSVHCFVLLLSQMYAHMIYPHSKSTLPMIQPFSTVGEFKSLLEDFGQLQRSCLWEDIVITKGLSDEWRDASRVISLDDVRNRYSDQERRAEIAEAEAKVDITDSRYKNVKIVRYMVSQIPGSLSKIFSGISKLTLSRRLPDASQKKHGFTVGEMIASSLIKSLSYPRIELFHDERDKYAYWLLLLSASRSILFDDQRVSAPSLQTVVVICFKRQGGIEILLKVLEALWFEQKNLPPLEEGDKSLLSKQAMTFGDVVVLQILSSLVNTKSVLDSSQTGSLATKERDRDRPDYFNQSQFLVELRVAILPTIKKLWESEELDTVTTPILKMLIGILTSIMNAEGENGAIAPGDAAWSSDMLTASSFQTMEDGVRELMDLGFPRSSVEFALRRSSNQVSSAAYYLISNRVGSVFGSDSDTPQDLLGSSVEVLSPSADISESSRDVTETPLLTNAVEPTQDVEVPPTIVTERSIPDGQDGSVVFESDAIGEFDDDLEGQRYYTQSNAMEGDDIPMAESVPSASASTEKALVSRKVVYVSDLNSIREEIRKDIVGHTLKALEVHPDIVFELSGLLSATFGIKTLPAELRKLTVLQILTFIQTLDMTDEEDAGIIKSGAHLLGLYLQNEIFFSAALPELQQSWDKFINLLNYEGPEVVEWAPDVLLIVERILSDAEQPRPIEFEHNLKGPIVELGSVPPSARRALFDAILKLPLSKSEATTAAVARILVFITRDHKYALEAFEKGIIASLFTAIQSITGDNRLRIQSCLSIILRHVIDSPETLERLIETEIRKWFAQPRARPVDVPGYVRGNVHAVLRNPEIFVKVTNRICKLTISPEFSSRQQSIILKEQNKSEKEESVSNADSEPDTKKPEDSDKEMTDVKPPEVSVAPKTPVWDKAIVPTGVIHYLLNELLATKEDPPQVMETNEQSSDNLHKMEFIAAKHPQFHYRAYLLEVLTELLSYNQCKIEFISYSRRGQLTNTPSKPRLAILNYFLNELLPTNDLFIKDDIQHRKRVYISNMTVRLLYALVASSGQQSDSEDEATILHIRKFVLDATLRAFKEASSSNYPLAVKYSRLLSLGGLCYKFLNGGVIKSYFAGQRNSFAPRDDNDNAIAKIMFEKNFVSVLTNALNDIDLNFPESQKIVRDLLRPLTRLARASIELTNVLVMSKPTETVEEDYISADSGSEDYREETPNFFSNSALGMFEVEEGMDYDEEDSEDSEMDHGEEMEYDEDEDDDEPGSEDEDTADDEAIEYRDEEMDYDDGESGDDLTEDGEEADSGGMDVEIVVTGSIHDDDEDDDDDDDGDLSEDDDIEDFGENEDDEDDLDSESIQDYDEEDEWQAELNGQDIEVMGSRDPLDEIARALDDEVGTPEQDGELDDEEDDDQEEDDGEENSEDLLHVDFGDDIDQDGDDGLQYAWEVEEVFSYDNMFANRRGNHLFTNSGRPPLAPDFDPTVNPLLVQPPAEELPHSVGRGLGQVAPYYPFGRRVPPAEGDLQVLNDLFQHVVRHQHHRQGGNVVVNEFDANAHMINQDLDFLAGHASRSQRQTREDPWALVSALNPKSTVARWQEELQMLFADSAANDKASQVVNHILNVLVPIALQEEQERKAIEAAERKKERERLEKENRERLEKEAQERKEREQAEAERKAAEEAELARREAEAAAGGADAESTVEADSALSGEMEDVEDSSIINNREAASSSNEPRIMVTVGGRELDVTGMGIDPSFLEALPEDMREEVLAAHLREMQANNSTSVGGVQESEIEAEFLAALPANIREELLQQEAAERRRVQRERELREAPVTESSAPEMDFAMFLATLDPALRQTILAEQDEEVLSHLPTTIAAEAHELQRRHNLHSINDFLEIEPPARSGNRIHRLPAAQSVNEPYPKSTTSRNGIQLVDRFGIASLVRLLYLPQNHGPNERNPLYDMLVSIVTTNRQSRTELFNAILSILQDGSADIASVEKSYAQISAKARPQQASNSTPSKVAITPKTPATPSKSSLPSIHGSVEISPLVLTQQCLQALDHIIDVNRQLASYFLIEHENPIGLKRTLSRKGKMKENAAVASNRYPINILLSLLDRPMVRESVLAMDLLSMLLQEITRPLQILYKKRDGDTEGSNPAPENVSEIPLPNESGTGDTEPVAPTKVPTEDQKKPQHKLALPVIPLHNLELLVSILTSRECPNRTLQQTLATMQNLSASVEVKNIFGDELMKQAQMLGQSLPNDLKRLSKQIHDAKNGSEVQGMALAQFSPASSDQAKLLRVLTAVDYLFDFSREKKDSEELDKTTAVDDTLLQLYSRLDFQDLWDSLGACLTEIQERPDMLHVATVLLPLIEAFMVVCKHEVLKESSPQSTQSAGNLVKLNTNTTTSENLRHLFFKFTDDFRKILNQMVRNNPKLMSGSFSILVKNPKVLDFDNKRNYFNRQLHSRSQGVHIHRPLALNVRRDQVFLDSYKAMYFKTGDEIKFSKLNIRFHGEEGVDAGGVTREWFQVLARQMFNPDYALFTPVASDRTTFHPNRASGVNPEHLLFFKFIGRIIGKALYEGRVLDCHFSRAVYKRILNRQVSLKDMETLDLDYYKSLVWMLENDITDVITETMSLEADDYGDKKIIDLVPNGRDIPVTEENKNEFVRLVVGYRLLTSVEEQLESFLNGFYDIVPRDLVSVFDEQELELLISGLPDIDVDDWKNNTVYQNYSPSSPQIQWFWRAVRSFDPEERAKLLQFVTGTSKVPLNGFSELEGMNGVSRFSIHRDYGRKDRLPSSHTCFNQLDMPEYESYEALRNALLLAITEGREGFGFA